MNTTQRELIGSSVDERGKTHHGKSNLFQETPKPLCSTFLPTDVKHCLNVGYTFVNFTTSEAVWKSHVCITRKSWPLFKSKKIAQVVRAWIQSKNSLVKHFEDMRLCRPSKEYLPVWFDPPKDESMLCLTTKGVRNNGAKCARRFRESLRRVTDGTEAFLILTLFILCLDKVSTDHAKLVPLGKVCTAKETLEKNTAKGTKCKLEPLISLTDDLSLLSNMAALESCPKHNMIAYLEKTEGNVQVHGIIDLFFLSKKLYLSCAHCKVTPLFDTMLVQPTQDEGASSERLSIDQTSPSPTPTSEVPNESLPDSSSAQPSEVPFEQQPDPSPRPSPRPSPQPSPTPIVPDSIPEPTGENLGDHSSNDTSLSGNEDDMTLPNVYDLCISLCKQVSDQAKEIKLLKAQITKLKKQAKPVIKHFKAYMKTVSLQKRLPRKSSSKKQRMHKKYVSKQGRKIAKGESSVQRDPLFDVMPEDNIDHMETEDAQSEGRTREMVDEDKEIDEVRLSTEDGVSTDKEGVSTDFEKVSTDFEKVSTDKPKVSTDGSKVSTDEQVEGTEEHNEGTEEIFESTEEQREGTEEKVESTAKQTESTEDQTKEEVPTQASQSSSQTPTSIIFGDDETIATLLLNMSQAKAASKEKEKGIDPKDKGKKKIEEDDESESEDDDIPQAVKKFKQLESDEELARKLQEEWEAEEERNRIAEEEATNEALIKNFDDIKARIEADRILAEKLQEQEREQFTIEERAKKIPPNKEEIKQESKDEVKEEDKGEENTRKRKQGTRKKMKSRKRRFKQDTSQDDPSDTENENDELRLCLTIALDEDKESNYEIP
ncbi:MEI2-like protein 6 [Tanacetum coccineum]